MLKKILRIAKRALSAQKPLWGPAGTDINWKEERKYWKQILADLYRQEYSVSFHPLQEDDNIVPKLSTTRQIQKLNKASPDCFFGSGYREVYSYHRLLLDHECRVERMKSILEFGVGSGRLLVHYLPFTVELHGCDVIKDAVHQTQNSLGKFARIELTSIQPPLPYSEEQFDFVYANSVFTHISFHDIPRWLEEIHRILKRDGVFVASVFNENVYYGNLQFREFHRKFEQPGFFEFGHDQGVLMSAWQSPQALSALWAPYFRDLDLRCTYRSQRLLFSRKK